MGTRALENKPALIIRLCGLKKPRKLVNAGATPCVEKRMKSNPCRLYCWSRALAHAHLYSNLQIYTVLPYMTIYLNIVLYTLLIQITPYPIRVLR